MSGRTRIVGEATLSGGQHDDVSVVGECKVTEDVFCQGLNVVGEMDSAKNLTATELHIVGNLKSGGDCTAQSARVRGEIRVKGHWKSGHLKLTGALTVGGDCESETVDVRGTLCVGGLFSADRAEFVTAKTSVLHDMGGKTLYVRRMFPVFPTGRKLLEADTVEFDEADIDYVKAQVLRGHNLIVGRHCAIGTVEYTGTLTVAPGASVGSSSKIS